MSTADCVDAERWLHTKGAPEAVLARCETVLGADGETIQLDRPLRDAIDAQVTRSSAEGLRLIAVARRALPDGPLPEQRERTGGGAHAAWDWSQWRIHLEPRWPRR